MVDGVLVCNKTAGPTSHDVVARVRRLFGQRRVGHAGTLDPAATGVLVVALGQATRLLPYLPLEPKRYRACVAFGMSTDSLDATGRPVARGDVAGLTEAGVEGALATLRGPQLQIPPMVSAIKIGGERLYHKARRGEEVLRAARPVILHELTLEAFVAPSTIGSHPGLDVAAQTARDNGELALAQIAVTCSAGTYVRVLAADLAAALGTVGHLAALQRTGVGAFSLEHACALDDLATLADEGRLDSSDVVLTPAAAMAGRPLRTLSDTEAGAVRHGRFLPPSGMLGPVGAIDGGGRLAAILEDVDGSARPRLVLT